jgi:hypothetical protein
MPIGFIFYFKLLRPITQSELYQEHLQLLPPLSYRFAGHCTDKKRGNHLRSAFKRHVAEGTVAVRDRKQLEPLNSLTMFQTVFHE